MENTQTLSEPWNSNGISSSCGFCIWHKLVRMFQWKHIYYSQDTIEIYSALCVARKSQFYECSTRWFPHIFATDFIGISLHKIIGAHLIMISRHTRWRYFPTPLHPSIHPYIVCCATSCSRCAPFGLRQRIKMNSTKGLRRHLKK